MKRTSRQPSKLSESLHRQLNSYALAASTAGVGLLALGQSAEAKVVYTPAHKWLPINKNFYLDLNHDGVNDFQLLLASSNRTSGFTRALSVRWTTKTQSQNQIYSVLSGGVLCAAALPKGKRVGPSRGFNNRLNAAGMFRELCAQRLPECGLLETLMICDAMRTAARLEEGRL